MNTTQFVVYELSCLCNRYRIEATRGSGSVIPGAHVMKLIESHTGCLDGRLPDRAQAEETARWLGTIGLSTEATIE